jgi:secondary thiamine-phosphate synthase enzyme
VIRRASAGRVPVSKTIDKPTKLKQNEGMIHSHQFTIETRGRGTIEITRQVQQVVERSEIARGLCCLFIHHTSASLIVCENADATVRRDLEHYAARLVPDGDPSFVHDSEGPDDMSAHIRSILTATSLTIPVADGRCDLGTWQGVFLWEHRASPHRRRITVTVLGEKGAG